MLCSRLAKLSLSFLILYSIQISAAPIKDKERDYLERYGYIEEVDPLGIDTRSTDDVEDAIKQFQEYAGLPQTGILDDETKEAMGRSRCGNKDKLIALRSNDKWRKNDISYRLKNYPSNSRLKKEEVDDAVKNAFAMWQKVSSLRFKNNKFGNADIEISFEPVRHGDDDFLPGELAHAFFPGDGGDMHIADSEFWTMNEYNGKNLLGIVVHELGHSLGLDHSKATGAVMAPIYRGWDPFLQLAQDDIDNVLLRYK